MPDLAPNYMKVTTSYDAKKGSCQRGNGSVDVISIDSRSLAAELSDGKMKKRPALKKVMKNFGSFRRRSRSAIKNPTTKSLSDYAATPQNPSSESSSPHYRKATSCSQGKSYYLHSCGSSFDSSDQSRSPRKSLHTFSRTSSMRSVKILINKPSFKSKRGSSKCCQIPDKATCSSTLKDSKFPEHVQLQSGRNESDRISKSKVCSYHHCALNGGHYDDPSPPVKRIYRRRRMLKSQKSVRAKSGSWNAEQFFVDENTAFEKTQLMPGVDPSVCEESSTIKDDGLFKVNEAIVYADLAEIAFGETSFPERSYQETLNLMSKYSTQEHGFLFTASSCCNCMARIQNESTSVSDDVDSKDHSSKASALSDDLDRDLPLLVKPDNSVSTPEEDESNSRELSENGSFAIRTRLMSDDLDGEKGSKAISSASTSNIQLGLGEMQEKYGKADPDEDLDSTLCPAGDSESKTFPPLEVAEPDASAQELHKQLLPKKKHMSMWNLIRRHMTPDASENKRASGADEENHQDGASTSPSTGSSNTCSEFSGELMPANKDAEKQEIELRKLFTIKLVREAIERVLLPEMQDQLSDDQSVTSDASADQESLEMSHSEVSTKANFKESDSKIEETDDAASKSKSLNTEDIGGSEKQIIQKNKSKRAPKHWSNLKKWILLQRFIKELEKVRKINPRKPRHLELNPNAERVNLRPQTADEKKRAEEWMLDHALQQAISQLAPTQQRKVELLIKAFETVVPPQGDSSRVAFSKLRANSEEHFQITSKEKDFVGTGFKAEKVTAGIDRKCEESDCSKYKDEQSRLMQKLDEVTSNEVLVEGKALKEDEFSKSESELQIDVSRARLEKEQQDSSYDYRKETSSASSGLTNAVDGAHETDMNVSSVSECVATENIPTSSDEKVIEAKAVELQGSEKSTAVDLHSATPTGRSVARARKLELDTHDGVSSETSDTTQSSTADGNSSFAAVSIQSSTDAAMQEKVTVAETADECEKEPQVVRGFSLLFPKSDPKEDGVASRRQANKQNYISMWHMISQHVLSNVASKVGNELLDGPDDEIEESNTPAEMKTCNSLQDFSNTKDDAGTRREDHIPSHHGNGFCRDDAVKLIREAVNEILTTPIQDDSSDTQSVTSDIIPDQEFSETEGNNYSNSTESLTNIDMSGSGKMLGQETKDPEANTIITEERAVPLAKNKPKPQKSKNWSKLKKLILLKRSIKALERAREFNPRAPQLLSPAPDQEPETVDLRHQMTDERKKAEQWMLDYAMQHIVTKLTPARKRRVAMLVEAFEAVVPLPEV